MSGRLIVFEGVEGCGKTTQLQRCHAWLAERVCGESISPQSSHREGSQGENGAKDLSRLSPPESLQHLSSANIPFSRRNVSGQSICPENSLQTEELFSRIATLIFTREPGGTQLGLRLRQLLCEDNVTIQDSAELLLYAADRAQHVAEVLKPQMASGAIILCDRYTDSTIAYQGYGRGLSLSLIHQLNSIATGGLESNLTLWLDVDVEVGLARTKNRGKLDRIEQADLEFHRRVQQGYIELAKAYPQRIVRVDASLSEENVQQQIQEILFQRFTEWELGVKG